jgi:hypothetical protein
MTKQVRGTSVRGDEPKRLQLSDGSRLLLDGLADQGQVEWRRLGRRRSNVSVSEARHLAGEEFARYVDVRTRAEAEWMRAVSDWYRDQAERLEGQLGEAARR